VSCSYALGAKLQVVARFPRLLKSDSNIARQLAVILRLPDVQLTKAGVSRPLDWSYLLRMVILMTI
jgi:hypothetical protein